MQRGTALELVSGVWSWAAAGPSLGKVLGTLRVSAHSGPQGVELGNLGELRGAIPRLTYFLSTSLRHLCCYLKGPPSIIICSSYTFSFHSWGNTVEPRNLQDLRPGVLGARRANNRKTRCLWETRENQAVGKLPLTQHTQ